MSKARDLANAGTALGAVSATELGYVDGVTSAIQTQIDTKAPSSTAVTLTGTQTLTNKTLTNPVIASVINNTLTTTTGDMIYASAANTPARLAIGSTDQVLKVTGGIPAWSTPASGVTTFTYRQTIGGSTNQIAYNGSNLYVAVGNGGRIYSSPDAITWTSRTSGVSTALYSVAFGNSIWVAVGASGVILSSTDGTTWTSRTSGVSTNTLYTVIYANSLFVAVGAGANGGTGGITTSSNGTTWTKQTTPTSSATSLYDISYGGGYYVAVGNCPATNNGYYSTNGTSWTVVDASAGQSQAANTVNYVNGVWVTTKNDLNGSATYNASTPNTAWTNGWAQMIHQYSGKTNANVYNNTLYGINPSLDTTAGLQIGATTQQFIVGVKNPGTTDGSAINSINLPFSGGGSVIQTLFINPSNGQLIVADGSGRVYTSF